jgi:hypothetical protein
MTSERLDVDVGVQTPAVDVLAALAEAEAAEADARAEAVQAKARAAELRDRATHSVGAPTGPAARLGWRRAAALAVGALLIGALLAVTVLMSVKHSEAAAARAQDRKLVEAASNGVVALLSIDHGRAEADVQRILDLSIGAFRDDFASRAGDFIKAAEKEKAVNRGTVTAAALETDSGDMVAREHDCWFSAEHAAKDSGIAADVAKTVGLNLPLNEATKAQYEKMVTLDLGGLDKSGIAELTFKGRHG